MNQMSALQLDEWLRSTEGKKPVLLDVREPWEVNICKIDGSINIPMQTITTRFLELEDDQEIVCICHHGMRSAQVAMFLERQGFSKIYNLMGGVAAWAAQVDPKMPQY